MDKKDSFWKILACLFLIWAFLFLWSNSIKVGISNNVVTKENKLTGNGVYKFYSRPDEKWVKQGKSIFDSVLNYIILLIFIGSLVLLIIYTIKAIRGQSKKGG